jgi:hypothetical protein
LEKRGGGGIGVVYKAEDIKLGLCSAKNLAPLNFRPLFMLPPFPVGIRDADRSEQGFSPLGDQMEFDNLKLAPPECHLRTQECLATGWNVGGLGCNEPPTP